MNQALFVAALLTLLTWGIHTFIGGREIARPLLASSLPAVPKYTSYYCWHIVTILLFVMAGGFAYAAWVPSGLDVGYLVTALAVAFTLWSLSLVLWKHPHPMQLPQWSLFAAISAAAIIGLS